MSQPFDEYAQLQDNGLHGKRIRSDHHTIAYCTLCDKWVSDVGCDRIGAGDRWFNECQLHDKSWKKGWNDLNGY